MTIGRTEALPPVEGPGDNIWLRVVEGPDAGASHQIGEPVLIGTSEVCDLQLTDRTVSRRHVTIGPSPVGLRLRDEDSRNGTWIGSVRMREGEVGPGELLRIGETRIRIEVGEEQGAGTKNASPAESWSRFGRFRGSAPVLQPLYARLKRAADSDITVVLEGESGTGKELLAEALHEQGARAKGPFVVVDCGAVPENLIESELFGHERGAFTGASSTRVGAFEAADGGTVFLDEIGELPLGLQTRLLRVLDRREVRRLGAEQRTSVDVRVVAASNRNLDKEVEQGRFRPDLFHRLAVALIRVPALRERQGDVEELARHFLREYGGDEALLTGDVLEKLRRHDWPGNVRELRNHIERLVLLGDPGIEQPASEQEAFEQAVTSGLPYRQARAQALEAFTRAYVQEMLQRHEGNVSHAAHAAGVARRHFQRLKGSD